MHAPDARIALTLVVAVTCLPGCAGNPVPREWRRPAAAAQRSPRGGWITIEAVASSGARSGGKPLAAGELIALDETAFHVLTTAGLQSVPRRSVRRITLVGYGNRGGTLALWAVAGGISTLSHGGFLLLTAPMWGVGGYVAAHTEGRAGVLHDAELARRFARFPQGRPPGFDLQTLGTLGIQRGS